MASLTLAEKAEDYLMKLCQEIPERRVGSPGNRAATDFFSAQMAGFGFQVDCPSFECIDWTQSGAQLTVGGEPFTVYPAPYALGCRANAPLVAAASLAELEAVEAGGKILLLRGELAQEQLMPKKFPWFDAVEHKRILHLLEAKGPLAIVAATGRDPQMAGGVYPFALIEDGDFDIPSVFMTEEEGPRLLQWAGQEAALESRASRLPARGCNVLAFKAGQTRDRIVLTAHIDAKNGTPGALDNAAGVAVLLLCGELLQPYRGAAGIEIVAINGEDYYANPGEVQYLQANRACFGEIRLNINIDGVGYRRGKTAYSLYQCPDALAGSIRRAFSAWGDLVEGESWFQGDHMLFVLNGRPALAVTSSEALELMRQVIHTPQDSPDLLDCSRLATTALSLRDLVFNIS
jgi:aminopeptidase YwaD